MKHANFLKNAAVISLGAFAAKAIGAVYRISLTGMLGSYGTGLYQMAYPLFVLLLTFSSSGIPSALARMIARDRARGAGESAIFGALRLFALLGAVGSLLMCALSPLMSAAQGERDLMRCYLALAPSVFLVALIAALRGYFQGRGEMSPTAFSEIVEQLIKAAAGLFLSRLANSPAEAAQCALWAVTLSELCALFYLGMRFRGTRRSKLLLRERSSFSVLSAALPVMAAAALLPLSRMADSVVVVRLLSRVSPRAVSLYGLLSGAASSLSALPATLCCGVVAATVPAVSQSVSGGDEEGGRRRAMYALSLTLLLSVPLSAALAVFARPVVSLLYPALSAGDKSTLVSLLRLLALSSAFLAGADTLSASLTGMGRAKSAALSMGIAVFVKLCLQFLLIGGRLGVMGAALAETVCFPVAFFLDLMYTVRKKKVKQYDHGDRIGNGRRRAHPVGAQSAPGSGRSACAHGRDRVRQELEERNDPV